MLDLFAGSGSLGLEAASRGAGEVCWVERHGRTVGILQRNLAKLAPAGVGGDLRVERAEVLRFLGRQAPVSYDLILMDPPYAEVEKPGGLIEWFRLLREGGWLGEDGLLTLESDARFQPPEDLEGWSCARRKTYGGSAITFWRVRA